MESVKGNTFADSIDDSWQKKLKCKGSNYAENQRRDVYL